MAPLPRVDVLLALVGSSEADRVGGEEVLDRLQAAGRPVGADRLLRTLLQLEEAGHVTVDRRSGYGFGLTESGEAAAYDLGPGAPVEVTVVMIDLVGFVAYTEEHGDDAGLRAALELGELTREELARRSGRMVKHLGDGVLGSLPAEADPAEALRAIAGRCHRADGSRWGVRAAARRGRPICHAGDLYGADVNLTARLCAAATPGQMLLSGFPSPSSEAVELLEVRGVAEPVAVSRVSIR